MACGAQPLTQSSPGILGASAPDRLSAGLASFIDDCISIFLEAGRSADGIVSILVPSLPHLVNPWNAIAEPEDFIGNSPKLSEPSLLRGFRGGPDQSR